MSNGGKWRRRRATLRVVPKRATVDASQLRRSLRDALGCLTTDASSPPVRKDPDVYYAQLEVCVTRTAAGELEYRVSYVHPYDPRTMKTGEDAVNDLFDYSVRTGFAHWEPSDMFGETLLSDDAATAVSIIPTSPSGEGAANQDPGAVLAAVIRALDAAPVQWGIQVVLSGVPRIASLRDGTCALEFRVLLAPPEDTAENVKKEREDGTTPSNTAVSALSSLSVDSDGPLGSFDVRRFTDGFPWLVTNGLLAQQRQVTVPLEYAVGLLPVPRARALDTGVGGTINTHAPGYLDRLQHVTSPKRTLGLKTPLGTNHEVTTGVPVGLHTRQGSVVHVAGTQTRSTLTMTRLKHQRLDRPTFVIADDPTLIKQCAATYCHLTATDDNVASTMPEHLSGDRLAPFLTPDRSAELRPWFEELLNDETVYLINLANQDAENAGRAAALLTAELNNAAANTVADESNRAHVANAIIAVDALTTHANPHTDRVDTTLRLARTTGVSLDLITSYRTALADQNTATVRSFVTSADGVVARGTGAAADVVSTTDLPTVQHRVGKDTNAQIPSQQALIRINSSNAIPEPVVSTGFPPHTTAFAPEPDEFVMKREQTAGLQDVLDSIATVPVPEPGAVNTDALTTGATVTAEATMTTTGHVPRRTGLPATVTYDADRDCYRCVDCDSRSEQSVTRCDVTNDGLKRAINCCSSLDDVDREQIRRMPEPELKLSPDDIQNSDLQRKHFRFLKGLYMIQTRDVDPYLEYDPLIDTAVKLRDDYSLTTSDISQLQAAGYVTEDSNPHLLYTLTADGRKVINEPWQRGSEFGPGIGELTETVEHQTMVRAARLDYEHRFGEDPALTVETYVPVEMETETGVKTKNIDVAVTDDDGDIIHATEAERENSDQSESVITTYRKLRAAAPETARWVVTSRSAAAHLCDDLAEQAAAGQIDYNGTTYTQQTSVTHMQPDDPGVTDIETVRRLRNSLANLPRH